MSGRHDRAIGPQMTKATTDLFGTPYTKALHLIARYRLRDYNDVKDAWQVLATIADDRG